MHRFKELEVWKQSRVFCSDIYTITSFFPKSEKSVLTNHLRRSAVSIPSNIAEGASRSSSKDFSRFLEIAIGSAYELETQLLITSDFKFIQIESLELLITKIDAIVRMASRLHSTLHP